MELRFVFFGVFAAAVFLTLIFRLIQMGRVKDEILASYGNEDALTEKIRQSLSSFPFKGRTPYWTQVKGTTAIIQFDTHSPDTENKTRLKKYNQKLFEQTFKLALSAFQAEINSSLLKKVIVSAYETRRDRTEDSYKVCVLSIKVNRELISSYPYEEKGVLPTLERKTSSSLEARFLVNSNFSCLQVVPFERELKQEAAEVPEAERVAEEKETEELTREREEMTLREMAKKALQEQMANQKVAEPKTEEPVLRKVEEPVPPAPSSSASLTVNSVEESEVKGPVLSEVEGASGIRGIKKALGSEEVEEIAEAAQAAEEVEEAGAKEVRDTEAEKIEKVIAEEEEPKKIKSKAEEEERKVTIKCKVCGWSYTEDQGECPYCATLRTTTVLRESIDKFKRERH